MSVKLKIAAAALGLALVAWLLWGPADLAAMMTAEKLDRLVARAGAWGPLAVVGLMTLAVVMSPIPSAPIALAAGAAYGHLWGTVYVLVGAELGALTAFGIARAVGREALRRWFGERVDAGLLGSQNALAATVFLSRLMPFVSFDLISYGAGLSCLHLWRFALATLAGIIPASFLLAHFGSTAAEGDMEAATWVVLAIGLFTGAPLIWAALRSHRKSD
jgi:uncharacterized membrane protein YdjX (TVP38/TMEM64 family)